MTRDVVVDASVAIKWFRSSERGGAQAIRIRDRHVDDEIQLCAPQLLVYEVVNALRFKPDLVEGDVLAVDAALRGIDLDLFPANRELVARAISLTFARSDARGKCPSVYDACYLALAEILDCPMITADGELLAQVQGHPLAVSLFDIPES